MDESASLRRRCELFAAGGALFAIGVGLLVLLGWSADIEVFKSVLPGHIAMNPAAAVAFVFAGAALLLQGRTVARVFRPGVARRLAYGAAAVVLAIAVVRLAGYLLGREWGLDLLLFPESMSDGASTNRMAPASLCLVLLGLALLLLDYTTARNHWPAGPLALAALPIPLLALIGYAYGLPEFYAVGDYRPMALHTSVLLLLLPIAILCARPARGLMAMATNSSMGGLLVRRLLPAMVLALFSVGWLRLEGQRRGFYGLELGVALYTVAIIVVLGALVWWAARQLHSSEIVRQQAEAKRDEVLGFKRLIMDNSPDVICAIDGEGRFVEVSAASSTLFGYEPAELTGRAYAELVHPDDLETTLQAAGTAMAGHALAGFNNRYMRKDGQVSDIDWSAAWSPRDELMFCVARDAAPRKLAEDFVRQSQRQTRAIIDSASDAFVAIDRFGMIIDWNNRAETLFGWTRAQALGRRLSATIVPPRYREAHDRGLDHYLATGEGPVLNKTIEVSALHSDGREFDVELTIWPGTTGVTTTFNAFVRDITERKRSEQAVRALNLELVANAAELQQTNQELESFSYSISHDLRAPLRHIDGYAQMLQEDAGDQLDTEMRRYLDTISDSARRMGVLIDDLLDFSKTGRQPVQRTMIDMDALVARVLHGIGDGAADATVKVAPLPPAHGDPAMLQQVWCNLLSNALKYSATRGAAARVTVSGELGDGVTRYQVRDNGVGFDMRFADKLFGVFQRLHTQEEFEGTGVGLAIVQRVVTRHGGRVWVEAEPDRGATFTIELPVAAPLDSEAIA